jgi:hypothetical protein
LAKLNLKLIEVEEKEEARRSGPLCIPD